MIDFSTYPWCDEDNTLSCPFCGHYNLHQFKVTVFDRAEDAETGYKVTVHDGIKIDNKLDGNPSLRRQGLTIQFSCENCDREPVLAIVQNKGSTYVEWLSLPRSPVKRR